MDSPFEGAVLDPVKCSKLSMEERREIVYELANWQHGAAEMLQSWSRQDILQILCAEMGKERKYTGLTKLKIIEHLLKVVSEKKPDDQKGGILEQQPSPSPSASAANKALKKPRKPDHPSRVPVSTPNVSTLNGDSDSGTVTCKNAACKARLNKEDAFCRRCSCCICHNYDDNKDPSLWLTCSSEPPFQGESCNMSCHLECALKHERAGIAKNGVVSQLDGSFYCVSCGKMNDLMRCWRKQLMVAKDTRRVDILCYRVALSHKLLSGTKKYQSLCDIVEEAIKHLEAEVGTLTGIPVKMGRGIVNRMSSGQEVQRLCGSAVASYDSTICCTPLHEDSKMISPSIIRVEDISATSVTVILGPDSTPENNIGFTLWHQKADDKKETAEPTCTLCPPQTKFIVSGLAPATEYILKVVSSVNTKELSSSEVRVTTSISAGNDARCLTMERTQSPITNCSTLSNPSSVEDETNNIAPCSDLNENKDDNYFSYYKSDKKIVDPNSSSEPVNSTNASHDQNPSCASDEEHATGKFDSAGQPDGVKPEVKHPTDVQNGEAMSTDNESERNGPLLVPRVNLETSLPITPCRLESLKEGPTKKTGQKSHNKTQEGGGKGKEVHARSSSKKRCLESQEEECVGNGPSGESLEYYIKVIRWLECEGHIDKSFRQKFLTWYSIRATPQETRIVKAFVDTLIDDPASLSEQLLDTFGEIVSSKKSSVVPPGFCLKLWH